MVRELISGMIGGLGRKLWLLCIQDSTQTTSIEMLGEMGEWNNNIWSWKLNWRSNSLNGK